MANPYFQFKQFTIWHDRCAMKVGTDSVLLGAWTNFSDAANILDIGTGSGILALMAAQKVPNAHIDAIEIEAGAVEQAKENFARSPWEDRMTIYHQSIQDFVNTTTKRYDIIISNPPYFSKALKSPDKQRTTARHNDNLGLRTLLEISSNLLESTGSLNLILPIAEGRQSMYEAARLGLTCCHQTEVKPNENSLPKRCLLSFSQTSTTCLKDELCVETNTRHNYSIEYKQLTKDFYLNF
jgi:tRNA1Val (adenine37-N6)-methyltransferase